MTSGTNSWDAIWGSLQNKWKDDYITEAVNDRCDSMTQSVELINTGACHYDKVLPQFTTPNSHEANTQTQLQVLADYSKLKDS